MTDHKSGRETYQQIPLDVQIGNLRRAMTSYAEQHGGQVHVLMHPDCPIAQAGIRQVDTWQIHVEETTVLNTKTGVERDTSVVEVQLHAQCPFKDAQGRCSEDPDYDPADDWWEDDDE